MLVCQLEILFPVYNFLIIGWADKIDGRVPSGVANNMHVSLFIQQNNVSLTVKGTRYKRASRSLRYYYPMESAFVGSCYKSKRYHRA